MAVVCPSRSRCRRPPRPSWPAACGVCAATTTWRRSWPTASRAQRSWSLARPGASSATRCFPSSSSSPKSTRSTSMPSRRWRRCSRRSPASSTRPPLASTATAERWTRWWARSRSGWRTTCGCTATDDDGSAGHSFFTLTLAHAAAQHTPPERPPPSLTSPPSRGLPHISAAGPACFGRRRQLQHC